MLFSVHLTFEPILISDLETGSTTGSTTGLETGLETGSTGNSLLICGISGINQVICTNYANICR